MSRVNILMSLAIFIVSGCTNQMTSNSPKNSPDPAQEVAVTTPAETPSKGDPFALNAANTKIEFVGTHVGEKPDPRKGSFGEFSGNITVDNGKATSITVEIKTASLTTSIEKLKNHLKSPDFFDVRQFPKASFKSTSITAGSAGKVTIKGEFTLLGVTKPISFPASISVADGKVKLTSSFTIDRTEFGMNYGKDKVEKMVEMTVSVGQ